MKESLRGPSVVGSLPENAAGVEMGLNIMLQQQRQIHQQCEQRQQQQQRQWQWQQLPQPQQQQQQVTVAAVGSHLAAAPGLQNQAGSNNCFMNAIIQSLWNCRNFRDCLLALSAAVVQGTALPTRHVVSVQASFV